MRAERGRVEGSKQECQRDAAREGLSKRGSQIPGYHSSAGSPPRSHARRLRSPRHACGQSLIPLARLPPSSRAFHWEPLGPDFAPLHPTGRPQPSSRGGSRKRNRTRSLPLTVSGKETPGARSSANIRTLSDPIRRSPRVPCPIRPHAPRRYPPFLPARPHHLAAELLYSNVSMVTLRSFFGADITVRAA